MRYYRLTSGKWQAKRMEKSGGENGKGWGKASASQADNDKTQSNLDIDLDRGWQICFPI